MDGGGGDDTITGGPGNEPNQMGGDGDDTFIWNPGDGSDGLVGEAGNDTMVFNGSAGNEVFAATAQGAGFRFTRDLGNIVMDATGVEAIALNALGGDDRVTTVPLAGTSQNLIGGTQTTADVAHDRRSGRLCHALGVRHRHDRRRAADHVQRVRAGQRHEPVRRGRRGHSDSRPAGDGGARGVPGAGRARPDEVAKLARTCLLIRC